MSKDDIDSFLEGLPSTYVISREFSLPRPLLRRLKEEALENGWTLNQALIVLINEKIEEI